MKKILVNIISVILVILLLGSCIWSMLLDYTAHIICITLGYDSGDNAGFLNDNAICDTEIPLDEAMKNANLEPFDER